jgi:hypothetical protein
MKTKSVALLSALALCLCCIAGPAYALGEPEKATPISKQEAMKKYPPPRGGYPVAERPTEMRATGGFYKSPYPPYTNYDCREIKKNQLVLDTHVKKVFALP